MTMTVKIEGMMCGHCEATVKKALEAFPQVDEAVVSKDSGTAVLTLNAEVDEAEIKKAIEDKDFTFVGIENAARTMTVKIEGMMCMHCEARVKKTLEALPQVDEAVVSHEAGTAVLTLNADLPEEVVKKAIEDQDYVFVGIE